MRVLPVPNLNSWTCRDCYYHDGKCEKGLSCRLNCGEYRPDVSFTNMVRRNILLNPDIIKENWDVLCEVDKELYIAIYGGV